MKQFPKAPVVLADKLLVERAKAGDLKAFNILVVKYQPRLRAVIARYIKDAHEQYDVMQESFFKAYRGIQDFREESQFYTWLYRIAVNTAKNYLADRERRPPDSDIDAYQADVIGLGGLEELSSPENLLLRDEIERTVFDAISGLPNDMQDAIVLREIEGMSYEDIASQMQCPVGTIRSRLFRAREMIDAKIRPLLMG